MKQIDVDHILESISTETQALERVRREIVANRSEGTKWMSFLALGAIVLGGLMTMVLQSAGGLIFGLIVGVVGALIIHHKYFGSGATRFQNMFKVGVLTRLAREVAPGMTYNPAMGISEAVFRESGLFSTGPDRYSSEDLFHGMVGETKIMFSEVHAEEKQTSTDSKGRTTTNWVTIFKGVFFLADFHKEFRSPVLVMPDVAERYLGWFGKKLQKLGGNLQKLENPEFEKVFVVRGVDPVESRYLLTPAMQERLLDLRTRLGGGLRIVFRDSHVWLAIPNKEDWFEADLFRPVGDRSQVSQLVGQLTCFLQIVEDLDLNTRIWTKQ